MALTELTWNLCQANAVVCSLLALLCLHAATGMSGWGGCLDGHNVFATIRENSPSGEVVAELMFDTTTDAVHWILGGKDADWFILDETHIRLNTSDDKVLDREVLGPVLMAELSCYEEDTLQSVYRIMVEVVNENDNRPVFAESTVRSLIISELVPVKTVVFTVQATDADNDKIIYSIDQTSPDAKYFKVDLPNSGEVILSKPLDYETKALLTVTIHASEMSTAEHFNTSTNITITVVDGDDQYPQFLPCMLLLQDETSRVCTSPVYTANVTEGEEDVVLDFSPGPIHAVDGDKELKAPLSYAILSGDDECRFLMDGETGEVKLTRGVRDRLITPVLHLQVMAYQDDDPRKYSLATVEVRVLALNQFHPEFDRAEYHGFVTAGRSPASLVNTYGSNVLILHVQDKDFNQGLNPTIYFTFSPTSNYTDIYQLTQEGLLIARTDQLKAKQKHTLEVMAVDQESGDATFTTVVVEVLSKGQSIPHSPLGDDRLIGCTVGKALVLTVVFMSVLGCILSMVMWLKKKRKVKRDPLQRGCVAQGKHPNVSLRWFQLMSHRSAMSHMDEVPFNNEEYGAYNPSFSFTNKPDPYTHQDLPPFQGPVPPKTTAASEPSFFPNEGVCCTEVFNNNVSAPNKSSSSSLTSHATPLDTSATLMAQAALAAKENLDAPPPTCRDPTDALTNASPDPATHDATRTQPLTCPDSQTTQETTTDDPSSRHSSQSSASCSYTRITSAEIEKPFCKPRVKTPPHSPLMSPIPPKQTSTPPPTPECIPLKAILIHLDTSPLDTSPGTPKKIPMTMSAEVDQPSASLDQTDRLQQPGADDGGPSEDRRPSMKSGNTQDGCRVGDEGDNGLLGSEDADKSSDGELEPDEEELLRVMLRCNPVFITFSK
ncbi:cadherin-related family member 5 [Echeneis naucrates]|uniref:cadherin-related family member 5 n=1 Tax=Echeneis naucrates TaxID=173247 RepID=UPI0011141A44|nr:cadherin-related family member 5-like [Echeneis naucrates]